MDNTQIIQALLEMAEGVTFLDDNPFKARAYRKAAQSISRLCMPVREILESGDISVVDGIGRAIEAKLRAWVIDDDLSALEKMRSRLPDGFNELTRVSGLGMKRIRQIHNELGISTLEDLIDAGRSGRLSTLKGFSQKNIVKLLDSAGHVLGYRGKYRLDKGLACAGEILSIFKGLGLRAELSGECRRSMEVINSVELVVEVQGSDTDEIIRALPSFDLNKMPGDDVLTGSAVGWPDLRVYCAEKDIFHLRWFLSTGSAEHVSRIKARAGLSNIDIRDNGLYRDSKKLDISSEEDIYALLGMQYIRPCLREGREFEMIKAIDHTISDPLELRDMQGTIHIHTSYSDGRSSLRDMVLKAMELGYEWIGISDHSKSAFYAGGMDRQDIRRQHEEIDMLNREFDGIKILKGIESDILSDGSLDYPDDVLETFDFVIAGVHSQMDMDNTSMTGRIIRAIQNPYTKMLAHPTGRLLLGREPYDVNMEAVIEAAIEHSVIIELNANPQRLDLDWRLIHGFIASGGRIALSPDAHCMEGLDDMAYGILMANKGFVTKKDCINTYGAGQIKEVFDLR